MTGHARPCRPAYEVNVLDRIRELALEGDLVLTPQSHFVYSFHGGYEMLRVESIPGVRGGMEYGGSYHPGEGFCEGNGICKWCGRTLW